MTYAIAHFSDTSLFDLQTYYLRGFKLDWDYKYKFVVCLRPVTVDELRHVAD